MEKRLVTTLLAGLAMTAAAFAGETDKKIIASPAPAEDAWQFKLALPGWVPNVQGDTGIRGLVTQVDAGPGDIIRRIDMAASFRGEVSKGRFGLMADFLYLSLSDGIGTPTLVKKVDLQFDQTMVELAMRWRVIDSPRGSLDLYGGVRYTNLFQQAVTQANSQKITEASSRLVDDVAAKLGTALSEREIGKLIARRLLDRLSDRLEHPEVELPVGPLDGRLAQRIRERIQPIIDARKAALAAAVRAEAQAAGATARAAAQQRVDALKRDLSQKIAAAVEPKLEARAARVDEWWDPFIGLRARYNFNDTFYATAKGDIGGFGVGSDLTWQASAALGVQLSKNVFTEVGYRALGVQYDHDGLSMDTVTHGVEVTAGINF